jgi:hypothetical protein
MAGYILESAHGFGTSLLSFPCVQYDAASLCKG